MLADDGRGWKRTDARPPAGRCVVSAIGIRSEKAETDPPISRLKRPKRHRRCSIAGHVVGGPGSMGADGQGPSGRLGEIAGRIPEGGWAALRAEGAPRSRKRWAAAAPRPRRQPKNRVQGYGESHDRGVFAGPPSTYESRPPAFGPPGRPRQACRSVIDADHPRPRTGSVPRFRPYPAGAYTGAKKARTVRKVMATLHRRADVFQDEKTRGRAKKKKPRVGGTLHPRFIGSPPRWPC